MIDNWIILYLPNYDKEDPIQEIDKEDETTIEVSKLYLLACYIDNYLVNICWFLK